MNMVMTKFNIKKSDVFEDVIELIPDKFSDNRGDIWTSFNEEMLEDEMLLIPEFKHDKFSYSKKNVLRGIHGDNKTWKMISCIYGKIFQVIVDLREDSKSFKKWQSYELSFNEKKSIIIPPNFGNAFLVLSDFAIYHYKLAYDGPYFDANEQFSFSWDDPSINISWPTTNPILSSRDK